MSVPPPKSSPKPPKSRLIAVLVVVAILGAAGLLYWLLVGGGTAGPKQAWYYDLNTGQLFTAEVTKELPVAAPSGPAPEGQPAGVRAFVFSSGDCSNPSDRFIGWLETLGRTSGSPAVAGGSDRMRPADPLGRPVGERLIRREKDRNWVAANTPHGIAIVNEVLRPDTSGRPVRPCEP
ncbi:MAG: hypothetical protein HY718_16865 [Planctomycetes bacterium]|nr:hypothetical protein [Planctomycetota bacterium]